MEKETKMYLVTIIENFDVDGVMCSNVIHKGVVKTDDISVAEDKMKSLFYEFLQSWIDDGDDELYSGSIEDTFDIDRIVNNYNGYIAYDEKSQTDDWVECNIEEINFI